MPDKKDIANRDDLFTLMKAFYGKLLADSSISYLFTNVAKINMDHHLPILVDFWDSVLFQSDTYRKNAMLPHIVLHQKSPLQPHHFDTWLRYFKETVDELFEGEKALLAKDRAYGVANIIKLKTIHAR